MTERSPRQRLPSEALIVAYAMSRLDSVYLQRRGLATWREGFAEAGQALGVSPSNLRLLRDEFDPVHGNRRRGWQRDMRPSRQEVVSRLGELSDTALMERVDHLLRGGRRGTTTPPQHGQAIEQSDGARTRRTGSGWTRDELLVAFRLYCHTPFGRLDQRNPEIVELADMLGRTPSAVAMKASNFASLDPALNVKGLPNVSAADRALWEEALSDWNGIANASEEAYERLNTKAGVERYEEVNVEMPEGPSEAVATVTVRRQQRFFRSMVLSGYSYRCAVTNLEVPALLNASHIIPWRDNVEHRANPANGIALNVLLDRAFDRGFVTFDKSMRLVVSSHLRSETASPYLRQAIVEFVGTQLRMPNRFRPDPAFMEYHRDKLFVP